MTYGWTTTKNEAGFTWAVTSTEWSEELGRGVSKVLKSGSVATRAKASGAAKRWVLFFRRGGAI